MRAFHTRSSSGAFAANPAALEGRRDAGVGRRGFSAAANAADADAGRGAFAGDFLVAADAVGVASALSLSRRARAALGSARRRADALCVLNARSSSSIAPNFAERRSSLSRNGPPRGETSSANLCRDVFGETPPPPPPPRLLPRRLARARARLRRRGGPRTPSQCHPEPPNRGRPSSAGATPARRRRRRTGGTGTRRDARSRRALLRGGNRDFRRLRFRTRLGDSASHPRTADATRTRPPEASTRTPTAETRCAVRRRRRR